MLDFDLDHRRTDFLESNLFNQGVRPAIAVGNSVSRIGGLAQIKACVRWQAQYVSSSRSTRGGCVRAGRKRPRHGDAAATQSWRPSHRAPEAVAVSTAGHREAGSLLYAGTQGMLDDVPVEEVQSYEEQFHRFMDTRCGNILASIREKKTLDDDLKSALTAAVTQFNEQFGANRERARARAG